MLPLFPYNGLLRPALMLLAIGLSFFLLHRTRNKPCYRKLLLLTYLGYAFFLLYATFLSRSVAQFYSYRLELIYDQISLVMKKWKPDALSIEQLFFTTNATTAIGVAEARGVILLAAKQNNIPVFEYTPLQVKSAVVGYGKAVKAQVMEMTRIILGLSQVPKPDDTADALAIAICHAHCNGSLMSKLKGRY